MLVTGTAGFIGSALSLRLLDRGDEVIGIDNHNDYSDPKLKEDRLERRIGHPNYTHIRGSWLIAYLSKNCLKHIAPIV